MLFLSCDLSKHVFMDHLSLQEADSWCCCCCPSPPFSPSPSLILIASLTVASWIVLVDCPLCILSQIVGQDQLHFQPSIDTRLDYVIWYVPSSGSRHWFMAGHMANHSKPWDSFERYRDISFLLIGDKEGWKLLSIILRLEVLSEGLGCRRHKGVALS